MAMILGFGATPQPKLGAHLETHGKQINKHTQHGVHGARVVHAWPRAGARVAPHGSTFSGLRGRAGRNSQDGIYECGHAVQH